MNDRDSAERFGRDVDNLLKGTSPGGADSTPTEYHQVLDFAHNLATADFSADSSVRYALRRQLLNHIDGRNQRYHSGEHNQLPSIFGRLSSGILASAALAIFVAAVLLWPSSRTTAQEAIRIMQRFALGQNLSIGQIQHEGTTPTERPEQPANPVVEVRGDVWIIKTSIGNFAGDMAPGRRVERFDNFSEVQAVAPFSLLQPHYLPANYILRETMFTPMEWVFLFYEGPDGGIIVTEMPVGARPTDKQGTVSAATVGMLTDKPVESVTLNGKLAGWIEGYGLMWEAQGVSYIVGGPRISLSEALRIADSIK